MLMSHLRMPTRSTVPTFDPFTAMKIFADEADDPQDVAKVSETEHWWEEQSKDDNDEEEEEEVDDEEDSSSESEVKTSSNKVQYAKVGMKKQAPTKRRSGALRMRLIREFERINHCQDADGIDEGRLSAYAEAHGVTPRTFRRWLITRRGYDFSHIRKNTPSSRSSKFGKALSKAAGDQQRKKDAETMFQSEQQIINFFGKHGVNSPAAINAIKAQGLNAQMLRYINERQFVKYLKLTPLQADIIMTGLKREMK